MYHYDPTFSPPAPSINLILHHPADPARAMPSRGKLDTGADLCVISQRLVTELQLLLVDEIALGRNALNHFTITLKGKDLTFELRDP